MTENWYGLIDEDGLWHMDTNGVVIHYPAPEIAKANLHNTGQNWRVANFNRFVLCALHCGSVTSPITNRYPHDGGVVAYRRADQDFPSQFDMDFPHQLILDVSQDKYFIGTIDLYEELLYPTEYRFIRVIADKDNMLIERENNNDT